MAFAVLFLTIFTCLYLYQDILNTKEKVEAVSLDLVTEQKKAAELEAIQKNIKLTISDSDTLKSLFVSADGVVDFIQYIESVGRSVGLKVTTKNIEPQDEETLSALGKENMKVSLETSGSWQATAQFLSLLQNIPYKSEILSVDFSFAEKRWNGNILFKVIKNKQ